ncbi:hypothetical protein [Corynebacterium confusum]|uniref:hypothetical protein n=1 Tax=Corynebacterium confusum TaxID=71254 RepID=UPI0025B61A41|nr:hypothetical protein [Corynebacterium confusum]WJY89229.1 hypothetical protein CCONF_03370 [Corynebacterium confusum]
MNAALDLFVHGSHGPLMVAVQSFPEVFADEEFQASHAGFNDVVDQLCPGVSELEFSLLNAAILRAAEQADGPGVQAEALTALHAMATALVR